MNSTPLSAVQLASSTAFNVLQPCPGAVARRVKRKNRRPKPVWGNISQGACPPIRPGAAVSGNETAAKSIAQSPSLHAGVSRWKKSWSPLGILSFVGHMSAGSTRRAWRGKLTRNRQPTKAAFRFSPVFRGFEGGGVLGVSEARPETWTFGLLSGGLAGITVTSKPASRGRIKTGRRQGFHNRFIS